MIKGKIKSIADPSCAPRPHKLYKGPSAIPFDDPRYPIFQQRYMVRVPWMQMRTIEDIRYFGTPVSGDSRSDRMMAEQENIAMLTINEMVELFKQGSKIGVVDGKDTERIYTQVSIYLEFWKDKIKRSINQSSVPVEDLLSMDQFAAALYNVAKFHFDDAFVSQHLSHIRSVSTRGVLSVLKSKTDIEKQKDEEKRQLKSGIRILKPMVKKQDLPSVDLDEYEIEDKDGADLPQRPSLAQYLKPSAVRVLTDDNTPTQPNTGPRSNSSLDNLLGRNKGKAV